MQKIKNYISLKWALISGFISSLLLAWPDAALTIWQSLPDSMKSAIPENYIPMVGVVIYMVSMIARGYQQHKRMQKNEQNYSDS